MSSIVRSNHPPDAHIFLLRPPQHQRASPVSGSQSTLNTNITMASGNSNLSNLNISNISNISNIFIISNISNISIEAEIFVLNWRQLETLKIQTH